MIKCSSFILGIALTFALYAQEAEEQIRVNQIGYYPNGPKTAVIIDPPEDQFSLVSQTGETVFTGTLSETKIWEWSEESAGLADFSEFDLTGTYQVVVDGIGASHFFQIEPFVHQPIAVGALRSYYYQRASMALDEEFAGIWNRPAGHPDNEVYVHASAATEQRPENTIISCPGGWYDAGDYNKYIVNSGITTYTLLAILEHFPRYAAALDTHIPESNNTLPDLLDEILWNLRWMLSMQDPNDGGVYHKCTCANFQGFVMPHRATARRYVVQKSVTASLDFAAVTAQASRILRDFEADLPGLADSCLTAANAAWNWAMANPNAMYNQGDLNNAFDPNINTGAYGDNNAQDEFEWAASELCITTGQDSFIQAITDFNTRDLSVPAWPSVRALGYISMAYHAETLGDAVDTELIKNRITTLADELVAEFDNSAYGIMMGIRSGNFVWGSNAICANQALMVLQAYLLTGEQHYLDAAIANLDYLMGRNATGYAFLTGFGDKTPMHIHHRQSGSDGIKAPVPGFLAGGPNPHQQDGQAYPSDLPAKSYTDVQGSYASNENCINWNAPLVYIGMAIEAIMSETGLPDKALMRVESSKDVVKNFQLLSNYPNPFNPNTTIAFSLAKKELVYLTVYDGSGRKIQSLLTGERLESGHYQINFDAGHLPSGLYFYHLETATRSMAGKMMLIK